MTQDDFKTFKGIVIGLAELRGKALSADAIELYFRAMAHWSLEDFKAAANYLARTSQFMPSPYEFDQLRKVAAGRNPEIAWEQILGNHGSTTDPIGARALAALGGWSVIGFAEQSRLPWLKKQFAETYESISDSSEKAEAVPQLASRGTQPLLLSDALKRRGPPREH